MKRFLQWQIRILALTLVGCASPKSTPEVQMQQNAEISRLSHLARNAFDRGNVAAATIFYRNALERAWLQDDPREIGNMSYNLAVCLIRSGDYQAAQELLEAAQTELAQAHANLADVLLVRGKLAALQGADAEALKFAEAVFAHPLSSPSPQHQGEARLLQSQVAAQQGHLERAKSLLQSVQRQPSAPYDDLVLAQIHRTAGHIQAAEKHFEAAAADFDKEAVFSRRAKRFDLMAKALDRAAAAYEKSGHFNWAADRWFRAARSYRAQRDEKRFEMAMHAAFRAAQKSEDAALQRRIKSLLHDAPFGSEEKRWRHAPSATSQK